MFPTDKNQRSELIIAMLSALPVKLGLLHFPTGQPAEAPSPDSLTFSTSLALE
jgi:hypothetical protein